MIVYNHSPSPIVIVTKWERDPLGGPAHIEKHHMIMPGHGIDLAIIGMTPTKPTRIPLDRRKKLASSRGGEKSQQLKWESKCECCGHPKIDHRLHGSHPTKRQTGPCKEFTCECKLFREIK